LNRFLRTSNRGEYEQDQKVVDDAEKEEARERLKKNKVVKSIVEKVNENKKYDITEDVKALATDRLGPDAENQVLFNKEVKLLVRAIQEEFTTNFGSVHYRSIINQSNDTKTSVLVDIYDRGSMDKKEFAKFLQEASSLKIISTQVLIDIINQTGIGTVKQK